MAVRLSVDGSAGRDDWAIGGIIGETLVKRQQEVAVVIYVAVEFLIIAVVVPDV